MVNVQHQIGAVSRSLHTTEVDGEAMNAQSLSQTFPTPIDDVWSAVTDPDRLPRWFAPVTGELRLGGRYQVEGNAGPGATGVGWDGGLLGLALLLGATEGSLSPAEAEAWADIASGTEAAVAERRAGATHAFFTGTGD